MEGETILPDPGYTPYYDAKFFNVIKYVKDKTPLNPINMSTKEWYKLLLEQNMTKREVDQEGRLELIPCKVEERHPEVFWSETYRISRLRGLSPGTKSFLFWLVNVHTLLPSKERLHHLSQEVSPCAGVSLERKKRMSTSSINVRKIPKLVRHSSDVSSHMTTT